MVLKIITSMLETQVGEYSAAVRLDFREELLLKCLSLISFWEKEQNQRLSHETQNGIKHSVKVFLKILVINCCCCCFTPQYFIYKHVLILVLIFFIFLKHVLVRFGCNERAYPKANIH